MPKLTKKIIESTLPQEKDLLLWDSKISGFLCKITPSGKKSYFLYYHTQDRTEEASCCKAYFRVGQQKPLRNLYSPIKHRAKAHVKRSIPRRVSSLVNF